MGASYPGTGCFLSAKGKRLAWGITINFADTADMFEEKIEGDYYLFKDEWLPIKQWDEIISVKGGEPQKVTIRETHHGPIVFGYEDHVSNVLENRWPVIPNGYLAFSWTGHDMKDTQAQTGFEALMCQTIECGL